MALAGAAKHYHKLYKQVKDNTEEKQLDQIHKDMDEKIEKSEERIMQQVEEIKETALSSVIERYDAIIEKLATHEAEAMANYERMFTGVSEQLTTLKTESDAQDSLLKEDLCTVHKGIDILTNGILSIQGKDFKNTCRQLLEPNHTITEREYEEILVDHETYNSLGGNHYGDELFAAVQAKYKNSL